MSRTSAALSSATQHAMPPVFGRKWGTECLNTRFPLPTLQWAGYSVKLIYLVYSVSNYQFMYKNVCLYIFTCLIPIEASRGAGAQNVTVKATACGFDHHSRKWNIYLTLYFRFFALVTRQSAAVSSATQHVMPPEFAGVGNGVLGSHCLSCFVRDTEWSWFNLIFILLLIADSKDFLLNELLTRHMQK